jgi:hypothetical protein
MSPFSSQIEDCVTHLLDCHKLCLSAAMTHDLEGEGAVRRPQHLRLLLDCAQLCMTTADALLRKSQFHAQLCALCTDVCETCARECEALQGMNACVATCRDCAESCRVAARQDQAGILKAASETPPSAAQLER